MENKIKNKRILTGIKPTGTLHLGNYLASIKPSLELAKDNEAFYFVANYHAITTLHDKNTLEESTYHVLAAWITFLEDNASIYLQSHVPEIFELSWVLSCFTSKGLLDRAHAYKDALSKNKTLNNGVYTYPVLMAADILSFRTDFVPVGKDQKQHVEIARDIAGAFNNTFGNILKLPEPLINQNTMVVPGIDGEKMSKSYGNIIPIFEEEDKLIKIIKKIKTDSLKIEDKKDPKNCTIFNLYKNFATDDEINSLRNKYINGGMGWGEAKEILAHKLIDYFKPYRKKYLEILNDKSYINERLNKDLNKVRSIASDVLSKIRKEIGII
jgi:tryptophanyl-tRNA synthetase